MNPRVQSKRLKRIENRPHYRSKNEQEKLDKLIFESLSDYTYSYDFLDEFERILMGKHGSHLRGNFDEFSRRHKVFNRGYTVNVAYLLKFLKNNLQSLLCKTKLSESVNYHVESKINKELNDSAFLYLDQLSKRDIVQYADFLLEPFLQANNDTRRMTNTHEFDNLLDCIIQSGYVRHDDGFDELLHQNWHHIVDEHNQKLKQC